jgi:predicted metal-dependent hydrolase
VKKDAATGDFHRMAEYESRLPPTSLGATETQPPQPDNQLEFAFAARQACEADQRCVPDCSRQELRSRNPGRNLQVPRVERPIEELQLELGVLSHMPSGKMLGLKLTENRHTIISVQRGRDFYRVRVHRMFAGIEPRLVRALARYVVHNDARASAQLSEFIERNQHLIRKQPPQTRQMVLRTRGQVHDLAAIFDRLNRRYFEGKHEARITWGPMRKRTNQRSIKVGSYALEDRLIRVHPALDQEMVPAYFLEWIVFHEMLHGKHAIRDVGGRRCFHPPEFSREERLFPGYGRARLWEKANMDCLLGG